MVKGIVEPATLVGFIHKCTGKKAAIIRAEPLHEDTPEDAGAKKQDTSDHLEHKNEAVEHETEQEVKRAGGGEEAKTEEPSKGDGDGVEKEAVIEENQTKGHLFNLAVPPAAVVGVAPEAGKMAMNGLYQYNYHQPAYGYAYPPHYAYQQYQYPYPYPYAAGNPAMYGPCPHYPPPQTFSDHNPDACTIM